MAGLELYPLPATCGDNSVSYRSNTTTKGKQTEAVNEEEKEKTYFALVDLEILE